MYRDTQESRDILTYIKLMKANPENPDEKSKRVYIRKIDPEAILKKSARKLPRAIESQRDHDAKRRKCEQEGRQPEEPATYRQEFCAHGANPTVNQRREKTALSTRRSEITTRSRQALEKMDWDNSHELSRHVRDNFMIESTRTSDLVESLYKQFQDRLELTNNNTPLNTKLAENKAFVADFTRIRSVEDYVKMVRTHGIEYALTPKQCEELGKFLKLDRAKWRSAAVAAGKINEDLEALWKKTKKPLGRGYKYQNNYIKTPPIIH